MDESGADGPPWFTRVGGVIGSADVLLQSPGAAADLARRHIAEGASFLVVDSGQENPAASVAAIRSLADTSGFAQEPLGVFALVANVDQVASLAAAGVDGVVDATGPHEVGIAQAAAAHSVSLMVSVGATSAPAPQRALALSAKLAASEAAGLVDDQLAVLEVLDPELVRQIQPILDLRRPTAILLRAQSDAAERVAAHALAASMGVSMILTRDVQAARRSVHLIDTVVGIRAAEQ